MWPDQVSNPGPPTYESGALPTVLRGPAITAKFYWTDLVTCIHSKEEKTPSYSRINRVYHF